jgi:hypothetical protein
MLSFREYRTKLLAESYDFNRVDNGVDYIFESFKINLVNKLRPNKPIVESAVLSRVFDEILNEDYENNRRYLEFYIDCKRYEFDACVMEAAQANRFLDDPKILGGKTFKDRVKLAIQRFVQEVKKEVEVTLRNARTGQDDVEQPSNIAAQSTSIPSSPMGSQPAKPNFQPHSISTADPNLAAQAANTPYGQPQGQEAPSPGAAPAAPKPLRWYHKLGNVFKNWYKWYKDAAQGPLKASYEECVSLMEESFILNEMDILGAIDQLGQELLSFVDKHVDDYVASLKQGGQQSVPASPTPGSNQGGMKTIDPNDPTIVKPDVPVSSGEQPSGGEMHRELSPEQKYELSRHYKGYTVDQFGQLRDTPIRKGHFKPDQYDYYQGEENFDRSQPPAKLRAALLNAVRALQHKGIFDIGLKINKNGRPEFVNSADAIIARLKKYQQENPKEVAVVANAVAQTAQANGDNASAAGAREVAKDATKQAVTGTPPAAAEAPKSPSMTPPPSPMAQAAKPKEEPAEMPHENKVAIVTKRLRDKGNMSFSDVIHQAQARGITPQDIGLDAEDLDSSRSQMSMDHWNKLLDLLEKEPKEPEKKPEMSVPSPEDLSHAGGVSFGGKDEEPQIPQQSSIQSLDDILNMFKPKQTGEEPSTATPEPKPAMEPAKSMAPPEQMAQKPASQGDVKLGSLEQRSFDHAKDLIKSTDDEIAKNNWLALGPATIKKLVKKYHQAEMDKPEDQEGLSWKEIGDKLVHVIGSQPLSDLEKFANESIADKVNHMKKLLREHRNVKCSKDVKLDRIRRVMLT